MAAGYGAIIQLIAGGIGGGLGALGSNNQRDQILGAYAQSNFPDVPDLKDDYFNGYFKQLQFTPQALALERSLRSKFAGEDQQRALNLYQQYGPQYAQTSKRILDRVDPTFDRGRDQLFNTVSSDLSAGSSLTPEMENEIGQYIRAGQAARGNMLGNAPVTAEAFAKGQAGEALKQQRIGNMESYLRGPSTVDKMGGLLGAGGAALGIGMGSEVNPNYEYMQGPQDWGKVYYDAAQTQFGDAEQQAQFRAQGIASAPAEQNPWLASLAGASGAIAGGAAGGSKGGGGGFGSMFGGGGGGGGGEFAPSAGMNPSGFGGLAYGL